MNPSGKGRRIGKVQKDGFRSRGKARRTPK